MKKILKKRVVITGIILLALLLLILLLSNLSGKQAITPTSTIPVSTIDAINDLPVEVDIDNAIETREVYKMPQFILSLPEAEWFTDYKMQMIAGALGFQSNSTVMNLGTQGAWQDSEGITQVLIDPKMGEINFSTAFNMADITLPETVPTQEMAIAALEKFFEITQLPKNNFNFEKATYTHMFLEEGIPVISLIGSGTLLQMHIPYEIVTVPVLLPVESYIVVDGEGKIRLMNLLVPNIVQTDQMLVLDNWRKAEDAVTSSQGAVIEFKNTSQTEFIATTSYPAYYINQNLYYQIDRQRIFSVVYVFEGEMGKIAVKATSK